jgi:hypothetical protein
VCKLYWNPLISRSAAADYFILILWIKQWRSASPGSNCLIVQHPRCGSPCSYPARRAFQHTISRSSSRRTSPSLTQASSPLILTPDNAHDNSPECDCYLISGPTPGYFQHHRFYYFHSIPSMSCLPSFAKPYPSRGYNCLLRLGDPLDLQLKVHVRDACD